MDTPIEICEERDVKGLYKKARAGEIKGQEHLNGNNLSYFLICNWLCICQFLLFNVTLDCCRIYGSGPGLRGP